MRVFISYRRDDSGGHAGRLREALVARFGHENVFMDIASIEPGKDFRKSVLGFLRRSDVALIVIGKQWATLLDDDDNRRLDNPDDLLRIEVEEALRRKIMTIPLLVHGATMPSKDQLPPSLAPLCNRQAFILTDLRWSSEATELMNALEGLATEGEWVPRLLGTATKLEQKLLVPHDGSQIGIHAGRGAIVTFSPDGQLLASGGADGTIRIWDRYTGDGLRVLSLHPGLPTNSFTRNMLAVFVTETVMSIAFSRRGTSVAAGGIDGSVKVWNLKTGSELPTVPGASEHSVYVAFAADADVFATASSEGLIRIWHLRQFRVLTELTCVHPIHEFSVFSGGRILAYGASKISAWGPEGELKVVTLPLKRGWTNASAFSRNGRLFATAAGEGTVRIWDTTDGTLLSVLAYELGTLARYAGRHWTTSVDFGADGRTVACAGKGGQVWIWDWTEKAQLAVYRRGAA